jgi:hypothetical protein
MRLLLLRDSRPTWYPEAPQDHCPWPFHPAIAIDGKELLYPAPWARDPSTSLLVTAEATRTILEISGLTIRAWRDVPEESRKWFAALKPRSQPAKLGLLLLPGRDFRIMAGNFARNVTDGRVGLLMAVAAKS